MSSSFEKDEKVKKIIAAMLFGGIVGLIVGMLSTLLIGYMVLRSKGILHDVDVKNTDVVSEVTEEKAEEVFEEKTEEQSTTFRVQPESFDLSNTNENSIWLNCKKDAKKTEELHDVIKSNFVETSAVEIHIVFDDMTYCTSTINIDDLYIDINGNPHASYIGDTEYDSGQFYDVYDNVLFITSYEKDSAAAYKGCKVYIKDLQGNNTITLFEGD